MRTILPLLVVALVSLTDGQELLEKPCYKYLCKYEFDIDHARTMMYYEEDYDERVVKHIRPIIFMEDGRVLKRKMGVKSCNQTYEVNYEDIKSGLITGDGTPKTLMVINRKMPGPQVVVYAGQHIEVKVTNSMMSDAVTIHWHGITQRGTPWMDGAGEVSQLPILPGESFTYKFKAGSEGTHFYHSHYGTQRGMGLHGPLIVLRKPKHEKVEYVNSFVMSIQDYYHQTDYEIHIGWKYGIGSFQQSEQDENSCSLYTYNADGFQNTFTPYRSGLINGKGRYLSDTDTVERMKMLPLTTYEVEKPGKYKFHVLNTGTTTTFELSIDGHKLYIVATEVGRVHTLEVDKLIISPGERYEFYIEATNPDKKSSYWIRSENIEWTNAGGTKRIQRRYILAILKYDKSATGDPDTTADFFTEDNKCKILNCPYSQYPAEENTVCIPVSDLVAEDKIKAPRSKKSVEHFLNFRHHIPRQVKSPNFLVTISGKLFVAPKYPLQMYPKADGITPCEKCPADEPTCRCTHMLEIPLWSTVQLVLYSRNKERQMYSSTAHPIHLHGYHFEVIATGYPVVNHTTAVYISPNSDIECDDEYCDSVHWSSSAKKPWENDEKSKFTDYPKKDTVIVPVGGYVVVRFVANNPGYWFLHCHMQLHNSNGMAMLIKVGKDKQMPKIPADLLPSLKFNKKMVQRKSWRRRDKRDNSPEKEDMDLHEKNLDEENHETTYITNINPKVLILLLFVTSILALVSTLLLCSLFVWNSVNRNGYSQLKNTN